MPRSDKQLITLEVDACGAETLRRACAVYLAMRGDDAPPPAHHPLCGVAFAYLEMMAVAYQHARPHVSSFGAGAALAELAVWEQTVRPKQSPEEA